MGRLRLFTRIRGSGGGSGEAPEQLLELQPADIADEEGDEGGEGGEGGEPVVSEAASPRPQAVRPPVANLSLVRRERRALLRERESRMRDLGGLLLEMYRRNQFREDLIIEHCAQAMGVENRIHELEAILARAKSGRAIPGPHCDCGAPLFFGARFCASCGRPTELAATGEHCSSCLQPLAQGANFCPACGTERSGLSEQLSEPLAERPPAPEGEA